MPSVSNEHMYPSLCMCELSVHLSVWPYYVTHREAQQTMVCLVPVVVLCVVLWGAFVSFGTFSLFSFFCITKSQSPKVSSGAEAVAANLNELINFPDKLIAVLRLDYKWQSEQAEQNKNTGHRHYITSMSSSSSVMSYCAWRDIHDCHGAYLGSNSSRVCSLLYFAAFVHHHPHHHPHHHHHYQQLFGSIVLHGHKTVGSSCKNADLAHWYATT